MNFETRNKMKEMRLQNHKSSSGNAKTVSFLCGYDLGFQDGSASAYDDMCKAIPEVLKYMEDRAKLLDSKLPKQPFSHIAGDVK